LITTREKLHRIKGMKRINIEIFSPEDAHTFLSNHLNDSVTDEEKQQLAITLGYLPLALDQAAAYITETQCSPATYLELFKRHGLEIFNRELSRVDYENTVLTQGS
jgi:hypothetical protein